MRYLSAVCALFVVGVLVGWSNVAWADPPAKGTKVVVKPPEPQPAPAPKDHQDNGNHYGQTKDHQNNGHHGQPTPAPAPLPYTEYVQGPLKDGQIRLWMEDHRTHRPYVLGLTEGQVIRVYNDNPSHVDFIAGQYKRVFTDVQEIELGASAGANMPPGAPVGR